MNSFYLAVALVAVSLSTTNAASHVVTSEDANGSQYLAFNGTISTSVTYPNTNGVVNCAGTASYGPYNSSYLYVGANPPWDPNPFFFELYHLSSEDAGLIGFTDDRVYNLDFSSSTYGCWDDDGTPCGLLAFDYHWVPEILLNLSLATIKQVKIGEENGYEISGDETSYIKNDTERASINTVDIYSWCYDLDVDFTSGFIWNDTDKWTYKVGFSNSTGEATISGEVKGVSIEITFSGERITDEDNPDIELVTKDESQPQFRYSNDSQIYFTNFLSESWAAAATPFPSASSSASGTTTATPTLSETSNTAGLSKPSNTRAAGHVNIPGTAFPYLAAMGALHLL